MKTCGSANEQASSTAALTEAATSSPEACATILGQLSKPLAMVDLDGKPALSQAGTVAFNLAAPSPSNVLGYAPAQDLQRLGDPEFCKRHNIRFPYLCGAMANGIASEELVEAIVNAKMLGIFGSAGLGPDRVLSAIKRLQNSIGEATFGFNLIHSPNEPDLEEALVDLYLKHNIRLIEASAFMGLTLPLVKYSLTGIRRDENGEIYRPNRIIAKVSRAEVARRMLSPAPERMLRELVASGVLTSAQAELAAQVPIAEDLTAEADSGGHTDNRPAMSLVPTMVALARNLEREHKYKTRLRVGAAGGIATPESAAAAFAMGAAYVVTGSVNQACVESGSSDIVRKMLAEADQADVAMAPAADMFEMGVKVQVLKRGTMFPMRAAKLYEIYKNYSSFEAVPAKERALVEKQFLRASFADSWASTRDFFSVRDPKQITRANADPKHKMALVFRSYLGLSSRWANAGDASRRLDYQVWCGPAMGAFNEWVRGSFLQHAENRTVATVAMNILYGAGVLTRVQSLRSQNGYVPSEWIDTTPLSIEAIEERIS